jgi:hypothetical protein
MAVQLKSNVNSVGGEAGPFAVKEVLLACDVQFESALIRRYSKHSWNLEYFIHVGRYP